MNRLKYPNAPLAKRLKDVSTVMQDRDKRTGEKIVTNFARVNELQEWRRKGDDSLDPGVDKVC